MIRDITLGQYYPGDSLIHRLDARAKIIATLLYIIELFVVNNFWGFLIAGAAIFAVIVLSHVPFKFMVRGLKGILVLLIFTGVVNVFLTPGEVLVSVWKFNITREGLKVGSRMVIRLVFLVIGSSLMTLTTTPNRLTDGLERVLKPLKRFKLPVHEVAMIMSIALGFIPILIEELDKIMKAQSARGADFESKKLSARIKSMVPILVPLFVSAFRRAGDLATAMESRCYHGGEGRTKLKPLRYRRADYIAYLVLILYFILIIAVGIIF